MRAGPKLSPKVGPAGAGDKNEHDMFDLKLDRRLARSENTQVALTRLLEAARSSSRLEALALGDDLGLLVAGAGAAELCDELAAVAPLAANDTLPARPDVRRLAVDGFEMFVSGRGADLSSALGRVADGCVRILVEKRAGLRG
jgi:hypothetical protein